MTAPAAPELRDAYTGKRVLVTGHTGFKGAWLTLWLSSLGAEVTGFALRPPTHPSVFEDLRLEDRCVDVDGDVRDLALVRSAVDRAAPDVVFHLAAQAIVSEGYRAPLETFATNVLGTLNVLEAVRTAGRGCAVVVVTSDKCYALHSDARPRREIDPLGGADPYSASKAAAEIATAAFRGSFLPAARLNEHGVAVATARAGNVIGGGDWAPDRIVADAIRALQDGRPVPVRNPGHVRPWQHVLEPLAGYLTLGMRLAGPDGARYCEAWNFGPDAREERTVSDLVDGVIREWGSGTWERVEGPAVLRETPALRLDAAKAAAGLGWRPRWHLDAALARTVEWYRARHAGTGSEELRALTLQQINAYLTAP